MGDKPIFIDLSELTGVDPETFAAADGGDRQAQKKMMRKILTNDASAEALTTGHWTQWMLRASATGSNQAMADALGSIEEAGRKGTISEPQLEALHGLYEQFFGPGEVGSKASAAALTAFKGDKNALATLKLFLVADRLSSGSEVPADEVQSAAKQAAALKAPGAEAFFRAVWAQQTFSSDPIEAFKSGLDAAESLKELGEDDPEYKVKCGQIAILINQIARAAGDSAAASLIAITYADQISAFQKSQETAGAE